MEGTVLIVWVTGKIHTEPVMEKKLFDSVLELFMFMRFKVFSHSSVLQCNLSSNVLIPVVVLGGTSDSNGFPYVHLLVYLGLVWQRLHKEILV